MPKRSSPGSERVVRPRIIGGQPTDLRDPTGPPRRVLVGSIAAECRHYRRMVPREEGSRDDGEPIRDRRSRKGRQLVPRAARGCRGSRHRGRRRPCFASSPARVLRLSHLARLNGQLGSGCRPPCGKVLLPTLNLTLRCVSRSAATTGCVDLHEDSLIPLDMNLDFALVVSSADVGMWWWGETRPWVPPPLFGLTAFSPGDGVHFRGQPNYDDRDLWFGNAGTTVIYGIGSARLPTEGRYRSSPRVNLWGEVWGVTGVSRAVQLRGQLVEVLAALQPEGQHRGRCDDCRSALVRHVAVLRKRRQPQSSAGFRVPSTSLKSPSTSSRTDRCGGARAEVRHPAAGHFRVPVRQLRRVDGGAVPGASVVALPGLSRFGSSSGVSADASPP